MTTIALTKIPARLEDLAGDVDLSSPAHGDILLRGASTWNNLPAGTDGAFLRAAGSGASPTYDDTFTWLDGKHTLKGSAVGSGGDRWAAQTAAGGDLVKVDLNGSIVHDLSVNTTNVCRILLPGTTSSFDDVQFTETLISSANGDNTYNQVYSIAFNWSGQGNAIDPTKIILRDGWEYRWKNGSIHQSERHIAAITFPDDPTFELRPITLSIVHDTKKCGITFSSSSFTILDESNPGHQLSQLLWDGTSNLGQTYSVGGVGGWSLSISPGGDQVALGRGTVPSQIAITGTSTAFQMTNNAAQWSLLCQAGNRDLEVHHSVGGTVAVISGTATEYGTVSLFSPVGQAGGCGLNLFAGASQGQVLLTESGSIKLVQGAGNVMLGATNTTFIGPSGSLTIGGGITLADAGNLAVGSTTGTMIGTASTQKIGFWAASPVAQQVLATGASHTVDDVITLLHTLGLCRQAA